MRGDCSAIGMIDFLVGYAIFMFFGIAVILGSCAAENRARERFIKRVQDEVAKLQGRQN